LLQAYCPKRNASNSSTSTCFGSFELIEFMCVGSTLSYPHKEFLNPPHTRTKYNPPPPRDCGYPQPARVNPPLAGL